MSNHHLEHDWFSRPLPKNVRLGERTWLYSSYAFAHFSSQSPNALHVGHDTGLYNGTFFDLGPDGEVTIGNYCSVVGAIFCTNGRITVGDFTFIAHEVVFGDNEHVLPSSAPRKEVRYSAQPSVNQIELGPNVWIGAQAIILGRVQIGVGSIIGAGTIVTQDVPQYSVCAGNPMRIVRRIRTVEQ